MSYLEEFQHLIEEEKLANFLRLWEEYCMADQVDGKELGKILRLIKNSTFAETFGQFAETALPLWKMIDDQEVANDVLAGILDLETTNSPLLADLAIEFLKKHYAEQKYFSEKIRLVGLRARRSFQSAISNFQLLTHMDKGKFVFHTGGWGVGEVMDISLLREHALIEFEGVSALKDLSFDNIFKNLIPLPSDHFLARRFGNPDALEKEGKDDPAGLIHLLLRDLGPKTAQEIKEELCELVIPEEDWPKWWQAARSKLKKDTMIKSPRSAKDPFVLRESEVPHEVRFKDALKDVKGIDHRIQVIYNFIRDFPEILKNEPIKEQLKKELLADLDSEDELIPDLTLARKIQITFLLEDIFPDEFSGTSATLIKSLNEYENILNLVEIISFKKRCLILIRENREDWNSIFLHLLFLVSQNPLRDYIFKELQVEKVLLKEKIHDLLHKMTLYPDAFFWYFQKVAAKDDVPLSDTQMRFQFLEAFLILLHFVETKPEHRDLVKKMHQFLTMKRYAVIRSTIEGASVEYLREFLLLASKCQSFNKHDMRILNSLAEVVQPSLSGKKEKKEEVEVIWTTHEGFKKIQERVHHLSTVETVDNAKEIEAARALGDLRENSEYKFALERRSRLQNEMKTLTQQLNHARILTRDDIVTSEVGVGTVVEIVNSKGQKQRYTLLGPWDADPEKHILSFQSKLAQAMIGCKAEESFEFQGEHYSVKSIESFLK